MDRAKDAVFVQQNKVMPEKPETSLGSELTRKTHIILPRVDQVSFDEAVKFAQQKLISASMSHTRRRDKSQLWDSHPISILSAFKLRSLEGQTHAIQNTFAFHLHPEMVKWHAKKM